MFCVRNISKSKMTKAPRLLWRLLRRLARGAALTLCLWHPAQAASVSQDGWTAAFSEPTNRYGHAIMGNLPEWGRLCLSGPSGDACVTLPQTSVFEDIAPRLHDVDGDGTPEAVVVESRFTEGAALVVYRLNGAVLERIATPHIGTRNRWLAPAGIADFDGDGRVELAFIDRPHLAKRLRIWRYEDGRLTQVAERAGLTNHRIGEPFISGGLRDCGDGPEIVTADATWSRLMVSRLIDDQIETRDIGTFSKPRLDKTMACQ